MEIAQEEIFGPALTLIPFDDEADAIAHRQRRDDMGWPATSGRAMSAARTVSRVILRLE